MVKNTFDQSHSREEYDDDPSQYLRGVKLLYDNGVINIPQKYILSVPDRPINATPIKTNHGLSTELLKLPIIDLEELRGPNRSQSIKSLSNACKFFGFFQVVNHGVSELKIGNMMDVGRRFFELPYDGRCKYMSSDLRAPVRYGTSFNQNKDGVFCWRDFLKLVCDASPEVLGHWPDSPADLRKWAYSYSQDTKSLFVELIDAILESLGLKDTHGDGNVEEMLKEFKNGSQLMVANCYPPCPQPELTLGMPPHSDYGFLTLLQQDDVPGLQIQYQGIWVTIEPIPNTYVVNLGDHLEIFSNGLYKSVLHRVLANSKRLRTSVASLHTLPFNMTIRPSQALIKRQGKKLYKDTNFADFLEYASTQEPKGKDFSESRKLRPLETREVLGHFMFRLRCSCSCRPHTNLSIHKFKRK